MQYHLVPGTELSLSEVCLGTMTFGSQVDLSAGASMLDLCLERGVNFIDTANVYNAGQSETILGQVLEGRRDRVVLASKVGISVGEAPDQIGLSAATITRQIEESLRRLRTDYLDLYYLHQPDYETPLEETLDAVEQLVKSGKVRAIGISNFASWQVCEMLALAKQNGYTPICAAQQMYNLLARGIEQEFLDMCDHFSLTLVAYNPLAGGLLTGKHQSSNDPEAGGRFDRMDSYRDRYWRDVNFQAVQKLGELARLEDRSLISLSLGWLLHHTPTHSVVVGASKLSQLEENLACIEDGSLSSELVKECDSIWNTIRGPFPKYNR